MTITEPTFSIIINTTDRAQPLQTLLRGLEHQSYSNFEVIVVVGPTRDNTLEVLAEYEGRVKALRCPKANLSQSRNIGLLAASGDIVAYIDDDAVPGYHWLAQFVQLFKDKNLDGTGGVVYAVHPDQPLIQHRIGIVSSFLEQVNSRSSWLEAIVPPGMGNQWVARMMGTNMAFRRQALLDVGGFDEFYVYIAEEADLAMRMINAGKNIHPVKEATVYHIPASSRNRVTFSYIRKWWLHTRSAIYFTIKNGLTAGNSGTSVALRCLQLVHGHWLWYGQLRREGEITRFHYWKMGLNEFGAAFSGIFNGVFRPPHLIDLSLTEAMENSERPILKFQNDDSKKQPSVDPLGRRQTTISMPESPLRICLLSSAYPPAQFDGVGRLTNLMARGLFELGHTVHVVTKGDREQVTFYDGAYVHKIVPSTSRYLRYERLPSLFHSLNYSHAVYEKIKRLILNDGIQLVDSPIWQFEGLVTAVSEISPVVVRLVTTMRQIANLLLERNDGVQLMGEMERLLLERADYVIPNTGATLKTVEKVYGFPLLTDQCTVVPYGIVPAPNEDIRPFDVRWEADTFTVLFLGRLEKRKGIQDLFKAIPMVLERVSNVKFIIAGGDNSQHDGFQHQTGMNYPAYFAKHYPHLRANVEFVGWVDDETLQNLYQTCDLFVAPSLFESFGLVYLEAMNYAKPVIGCQAGGIPEVVAHGESGLLVEPAAPVALAEAIVSLLRSPQKLRGMGLAGRARLLEKFTYLQMAQAFAEVYKSVIRNFKR